MKVNVRQELKDYENNIIKSNSDPKSNMILLEVFSTALNNTLPSETMTSDDKNKIFNLSLKMYANKEVNMTVNEAAMIKERVGKLYGPLIYGRVCQVLDGESTETEKEELEVRAKGEK